MLRRLRFLNSDNQRSAVYGLKAPPIFVPTRELDSIIRCRQLADRKDLTYGSLNENSCGLSRVLSKGLRTPRVDSKAYFLHVRVAAYCCLLTASRLPRLQTTHLDVCRATSFKSYGLACIKQAMHGYDASRAGPVDYGYAGHGHGAEQHDQQHQYQSTNTQWGEPQQGHGNGYIDHGKHQQIGYTSYQQPRYRAGPSASSSSSLPFSQPRADHAGIYAQRQQYPQQQQQQAHQYNQQYDLPYNQNAGGSSTQPNYQSSTRPPGTALQFARFRSCTDC